MPSSVISACVSNCVCGQSVPQTQRSGAAATKRRATGSQVVIGRLAGTVAADLHPDIARLQQAQRCLELGALRPVRRIHAGHVIEHQRHRQAREPRRQLLQHRALHVELDVPAEARHAPR
jgi:hypothetical protein